MYSNKNFEIGSWKKKYEAVLQNRNSRGGGRNHRTPAEGSTVPLLSASRKKRAELCLMDCGITREAIAKFRAVMLKN